MADNEFNGYIEKSERFTFNEKGALTIPKEVRELAYHISIDIEILSIARGAYFSYKSIPASSFYGYVIIVLRDMSLLKIPIENSRQRLWTDIIHAAFVNWYTLYLSYVNYLLHKDNNNLISLIGTQLGVSPVPLDLSCPSPPVFIETEIREIYVKTSFGTRFAVEINWWEPVPVVYGDCSYDGKSQQLDDPEKDAGLPNESQPAVADNPNSPYAGYPAPTSNEGKALPSGNWNNIKDLDGLDNSNPENNPSNPNIRRWALLEGSYNDAGQGCSLVSFSFVYQLDILDLLIVPTVRAGFPIPNGCGGNAVLADLIGDVTGRNYDVIGGNGTYVITYEDAESNPYD